MSRFQKVGIVTIIESVTMLWWFALVLSKQALGAIVVLEAGLITEHLVRMTLFKIPLTKTRVIDTLIFSTLETGTWALWHALFLPVLGPVVGNAVLAVLLTIEHTLTANVVLGRPLLSNIFDAGTLNASIVESVGAALWRTSVLRGTSQIQAIGIFAVFNYFEHQALIDAEEGERAP